MNEKKFGKTFLYTVLIVMLATILFWGIRTFMKNPILRKSAPEADTEDLLKQEEEQKERDTDTENPINAKSVSKWIGMLPNDENVYEIGEPFTVEYFSTNTRKEGTLECCMEQVEFTKNAVDTDAVYYAAPAVLFDEEYNITNDFSYIVADTVFRNKEDTDMEIYVNFVRYIAIVPETGDVDPDHPSGELQGYKTKQDQPDYDKSYAKVTIPAGGEFSCRLVYIEKDETIEGKQSYFKFSRSGAIFPPDENTCYVKVG